MLLLMKPLELDSELLCRPKGRDWARSGAQMLDAPSGLLRLSAAWKCWYGFALRTPVMSSEHGLHKAIARLRGVMRVTANRACVSPTSSSGTSSHACCSHP